MALAYDQIIPGYANDSAATLRLWGAYAGDRFDLADFNKGDYFAAVQDRTLSKKLLVFYIQMTQLGVVVSYVYAKNIS
ncbi:glycogen phosphorylase [Pasteurella canis]|uniref:Alpha-1,4 glucan phosphorylase n=1 Tax=Pasteurella canis TaxID=753 RepID=A0A379ES00_9PAST|nr:glycogen phosphorylase [Pasteurella canis]